VCLAQRGPDRNPPAANPNLRFVAEYTDQRSGARAQTEAPTVNVVFYGEQPAPKQAEEVVGNCLKAAAAMRPGSGLVGKAWYAVSVSETDRQPIAFAEGVDTLSCSAEGNVARVQGGAGAAEPESQAGPEGQQATPEEEQEDEVDVAAAVVADAEVVSTCKDVQPARLEALVARAVENVDEERKLIVKAMRTWCKENDVSISRKVRSCISAISKAVVAARPEPKVEIADLAAAVNRGSSVYRAGQCGRCHQANGTGGPRGPDLTDNQWLHIDGSLESIREIIVSGVPEARLKDNSRQSGMPPATDLVTDENELTDLAAYVHSLSQR
jgi:mono/diheme cytochrome c family protein